MTNFVSPALEPYQALEQRILAALTEASTPGHFLPYSRAVEIICRARFTRRLALKVLSDFSRRGLLEASNGHGVKLLNNEGGGAGR